MTTLAAISEDEYKTLPPSAYGTPYNSDDLFSLAKTYTQLAVSDSEPNSSTGTAILERLTADMLACVAQGKDPSAVVDLCRDKWLAFCERNNKRVRESPKIATGPSKGKSILEHEWCSPAAFASRALFVLAMVPDEEVTVKVFVGKE
jgi:hypothetical protein